MSFNEKFTKSQGDSGKIMYKTCSCYGYKPGDVMNKDDAEIALQDLKPGFWTLSGTFRDIIAREMIIYLVHLILKRE
jgi:hypothetical protein